MWKKIECKNQSLRIYNLTDYLRVQHNQMTLLYTYDVVNVQKRCCMPLTTKARIHVISLHMRGLMIFSTHERVSSCGLKEINRLSESCREKYMMLKGQLQVFWGGRMLGTPKDYPNNLNGWSDTLLHILFSSIDNYG